MPRPNSGRTFADGRFSSRAVTGRIMVAFLAELNLEGTMNEKKLSTLYVDIWHWVYKVLQEHKSILLNCFFYSKPNEMFNLEVSEFDVDEIQQTIITGLSNGFLFLTNEEGERIAFDPDNIKECRYDKPSERNDDSSSNPTFLNIESSVQDIPEDKRE